MLRRWRAITASLTAWANSRPSPKGENVRVGTLRRWLAWSCVIAIAVLLVSLAAGNHQRYAPGFDILDEAAHYDYALDLTHGHVPVSGERLSQSTMRMVSCLGEFGFPPRGCSVKERNPASFPAGGYSYESVAQPPLGYLPYLLTAQPNDSPRAALVAARWGGFVWSVVAAGLLVWVGWLSDLSLLELGTVLSICLLSPVEVHAAATVTNDSAGVVAGAAVLGTFLAARRRATAMAGIGLVVGLLVGFMKGLFVVAPFVILAAVFIADLSGRHRPQTRRFLAKVRLRSLDVPRRSHQLSRLVVDSGRTRHCFVECRAPCSARLPDDTSSAPLHHSRRNAERNVGFDLVFPEPSLLAVEPLGLRESGGAPSLARFRRTTPDAA